MKIPITQSKDWQKLQNDLKETSFFEKTKDYQYLAILKKTPVGNYLFLPYGPVSDTKEAMRQAIENITNLALKNNCIFIRIEPQLENPADYLPRSAKKVKDISPADTWVLDLTPDEPTLISHFSQGTRTRYNTYAKKGLSVETTNDLNEIKHLVKLQSQLFKQKHLTTYDEHYLSAELAQPFATLYLVKYHRPKNADLPSQESSAISEQVPEEGQVLAASLFFDYNDTRYYMQSAADLRYRKLPATVALLTSAIFDAKKQGIKKFDFWGIAPDGADQTHPWYGFTEFKKSFGGAPKHYAGTYDIILKPLKYRLFQKTKQLKKILH